MYIEKSRAAFNQLTQCWKVVQELIKIKHVIVDCIGHVQEINDMIYIDAMPYVRRSI